MIMIMELGLGGLEKGHLILIWLRNT